MLEYRLAHPEWAQTAGDRVILSRSPRSFEDGNFIQDCIRNEPIVINGDGSPMRSNLYANDVLVLAPGYIEEIAGVIRRNLDSRTNVYALCSDRIEALRRA